MAASDATASKTTVRLAKATFSLVKIIAALVMQTARPGDSTAPHANAMANSVDVEMDSRHPAYKESLPTALPSRPVARSRRNLAKRRAHRRRRCRH